MSFFTNIIMKILCIPYKHNQQFEYEEDLEIELVELN